MDLASSISKLALYSTMITLGLYLFKAGDDPAANKTLIGFLIWSSFAHLVVLVFCVMFDDTPSYSGPTMMGIDFPEKVMGIAHWQNISPIGDVPLMVVFFLGDLFLVKMAFDDYLLPF